MNHKRIHAGDKLHTCGTCGKRFTHPSSIFSHSSDLKAINIFIQEIDQILVTLALNVLVTHLT